ncbi:hypothetical protein Tco_1567239, partial [Tanacetum coccineum]
GNKAYLLDYEDFNGGFVAFGSDPKGGTGPNWMFDLDFLSTSMNYIPVSVENQVIVDAGTQDSYVAGSSGKDMHYLYTRFVKPIRVSLVYKRIPRHS